ncbi:MAG TPA: nickel pincer cofactor biosynthesis protein LarC [Syntrophales bacterium]|nr:nickel pincer cofactor biosynthesis protein LarC [Syntrophales bacterium]
MRIAYFDCFSGISGNMILGALIDAGLDFHQLKLELGKLKISGYTLKVYKTTRKGISGTMFTVNTEEDHVERHLRDIEEIIDHSDLGDDIKSSSKAIFNELAHVEAKIHNSDPGKVHFHEIGGLDSIIDIVGSLIGMKLLGIEAVYASKIPVETGFVECDHGILPLPAPATLELLKGIPVYASGMEKELVTPTGIAILKNIAKSFGTIPNMKVNHIGYGAGSRNLKIPNLLRVWLGEASEKGEYEEDEVILVETNLDNMNPEFIGYASEKLLERGALDVFMTPIFMKKNRPGTLLSVLITPDKLEEIISIVFAETTSLGIRFQRLKRRKLLRELVAVETPLGSVRVKVSRTGREIKNISPEYDDCKEIAIKQGISLRKVYEEVKAAARKILSGEK